MHKSASPTQTGDSSWKIVDQFRQISEKMFFSILMAQGEHDLKARF